ncbi:hypothetical protein [Streptomyces kaniharaensis]|nr:hypothetical protein [Streptomyces kaniharaensis]
MDEQHGHEHDDDPVIPHVDLPGQRPSTPIDGMPLRLPTQRHSEQSPN